MPKITLKQYCQEHGISMEDLAALTGVSDGTLYNLDNGANTTVEIINKIYNGTKEKFGVGLVADMYLDIHKDIPKDNEE